MSNVQNLLQDRLKKGDNSSKMAVMAQQTASGNRTSFAGVFSVADLSDSEKEFLKALLNEHTVSPETLLPDLQALIAITAEVKAINNQAALLHGERIKRAHTILTRYQDGAFTAWLIATYGNRQTPYNFFQYYEFCEALPKQTRLQLDAMPRQAIYTLASRNGSLAEKKEIIENYAGETKSELLQIIRKKFPLSNTDKRRQNVGEQVIQTLTRLIGTIKQSSYTLSPAQTETITHLLSTIRRLTQNGKHVQGNS